MIPKGARLCKAIGQALREVGFAGNAVSA